MSLTQIARGRSRRIVAVLVAGLALAAAVANPAHAVDPPPGSPFQVFVDTTSSADPADAIQNGWWGHEGGAGDGTGTASSFLDVNGSDPALATTFPDLSNVRVAFVATSADGSAEHPAVTAGESVGSAFTWFMDAGVQTGLNGNTNPNDSVNVVSTGAEFDAWDAAGQPVQGFDNSLVLHDVTAPGDPISTAPKGKSILNRWAAGQNISMVFYATTGALDAHGEPIVAVGGDGHAITAYLPFTTVRKPGDALRTSAGYHVPGARLTLSAPVYSSTGASLTATVAKTDASLTSDPTGSVEFALVLGGVDQTPTSVALGPDGTATLSVTGFPPGSAPKKYDIRYVPDSAAQATYQATPYVSATLINQIATTTSLGVTGGATDTLTAHVSPAAAGQVTFKNGTTTLGTVSVAGGTARLIKSLTAGKHVLSATFTPSTSTYKASSASKTIWQPTISTTVRPSRVVHGTRPRLSVRVIAAGTSVSGTVTIVFDPPTGATRRITVTLRAGSATVLLPRTVKGRTRITLMYHGHGPVLAANKILTLRVL